MVEDPDGSWIMYHDHNEYYKSRWKHTNKEFKSFYSKLYENSILINKLKATIVLLSILLITSLVF